MLSNEYAYFTNELGTGLQEGYGTMTPYAASATSQGPSTAIYPNGARNPLGAVYFRPAFSQGSPSNTSGAGGGTLSSVTGYGAGLWMKYVLYKSTSNPAVQTGPAPVYWADETFTVVTGKFTEAYAASSSACMAGWLLPNAGTVAGIGAGTTLFTATLLNNNSLGSYVWIGLQGFIPSAYLSAGAQGNMVYGSGDFSVTAIAQGSNFTHNYGALVIGVVTSNIGDIIATCPVF